VTSLSLTVRRLAVLAAAVVLLGATVLVGLAIQAGQTDNHRLPRAAQELLAGDSGEEHDREFQEGTQGQAGGESAEALTAAQQWAEARTAPGIVAPGAYSAALAQLNGLTVVGSVIR